MAKDPAFLFYPGDWLGGTMGMTFEEKGAYIELLMLQFNRGHMTEDMIGHIIGQLWVKVKVKFRMDADGLWYNERLEIEKEKRKSFVNSRVNNKKGKNQFTKKRGHMTSHMENENINENINTDINGNKNFPIPKMQNIWKKFHPQYAQDQKRDFPALQNIWLFISNQDKVKRDTRPEEEKVMEAFSLISEYASNHKFFKNYSIRQLDNNIQSVITNIQNGTEKSNGSLTERVQAKLKERIAGSKQA